MASMHKSSTESTEELLVFGYSCKLFRDDEKAIFIENGNHLIPWMGDKSMMMDRYDVRGALCDLGAAASVGSPVDLSETQLKEEELAECERYLALHCDLEAAAEGEEEETKRLHIELASGTSDFNQVEYSYNAPSAVTHDSSAPYLQQQQQQLHHHHQQQQQHQSDSHHLAPAAAAAAPSTPQAVQQDTFRLPASLVIPPDMIVPTSLKQHKIIVKTASFIAKQGSQMEIVLKTKQTGNALFGFLSFDNSLNRYYKHIVTLIKSGRYHEEEQQEEEAPPDVPAASFNPSADAAPGSATPSKTSAVSADCSYSKLISKIKENQAKQCQSQAPANIDPVPQQEKSIQSSSVASNANDNSSLTPKAAATVVPGPKPFMGLVDYPSFNQADESDYSGSESDSQPSAVHLPTVQPLPAQNGDIKTKKSPNSKESNSLKKKNRDSSRSNKKSVDENDENFDDIKWPSPREQMVIDKIACYIVKNGAKFEQAIKARGDARFHFLKTGHEFNAYFELKRSLLTEVFGVCVSNSASKRAESAKDMKTVVAASKSMLSTQKSRPTLPTISFKLKHRKDQECALPPTSFPLESSSSEEDLENLEADEREKREQQRQERRQWRQMKREQFEREKKERKLREEKEKEEQEARMREEQVAQEKLHQNSEADRLKALQDEENASADEEMYDIFKYAQENEAGEQDKGDSGDACEQPARAGRGSDKRLKRKKAAHAFISKLRVGPEPAPPQIIGPQLPPEIAALMMAATTSPPPPPSPLPSSPSLTPPPSFARDSASPLPNPSSFQSPRMSYSPARSPSPAQQTPSLNGASRERLQSSERAGGSVTPPLPSASVSTFPLAASSSSTKKPSGLLAATVTSLLSNDEAGASDLIAASSSQASSALDVYSGSRSSRGKKRKSSKHRHNRSVSVSPDRSSSTVSSKKRKRKHHRHQRSSHKKRRHHSTHSSSKKSSSRSSSSKKKSKKKKSKSSKKGKHKKSSRRRRSESASPYSSDESSASSQSSSESDDSSESYVSRKSRSVSNEGNNVQTEDEIQVIDSDSCSSSVQSVRSSVPRSLAPQTLTTVTTASSRASSASRDALLALDTRPLDIPTGVAESPSTPAKVSLPASFDLKTSSALAKISEGLRAKVHALMEKNRPSE